MKIFEKIFENCEKIFEKFLKKSLKIFWKNLWKFFAKIFENFWNNLWKNLSKKGLNPLEKCFCHHFDLGLGLRRYFSFLVSRRKAPPRKEKIAQYALINFYKQDKKGPYCCCCSSGTGYSVWVLKITIWGAIWARGIWSCST